MKEENEGENVNIDDNKRNKTLNNNVRSCLRNVAIL